MPEYFFCDPDDETKVVSVVQKMNDKHELIDNNGKRWRRMFTVPQAIISAGSEVDPFDIKSHVDKTGNMKGTMGDLFDFSKEMSDRRAEHLGHEDPLRRKFLNDYHKRSGSKHIDDLPKRIETDNAIIDLTKPMELPTGGAYDLPTSVGGDD